MREARAVAEGRVLVLRVDGTDYTPDPACPEDVEALEWLGAALAVLDAHDATVPGCWRGTAAGRA